MRLDARTIPNAPSNLAASAVSASQINLSWADNSNNEDGFRIERAWNLRGVPWGWRRIATVSRNVTNYPDTGLLPNRKYWYRIQAFDARRNSSWSNRASARTLPLLPATPSSLTATAVSTNQINLSWKDNSNKETGFKVEQSLDGTNFTEIAQVLANTTNYLDSGLLPNTTYSYRVRAYNAAGNSAFSSVASASTPAPPCPLSVVGWGSNGNGQATPPADLTNAVAIAAGGYHSLALKKDGTVVGWGANWAGQATTPTNLTGVVAIAAGAFYSLALKSDGTVVGWGYDYYGQATPPTNLNGVVAIAAGDSHSLALKNDGTVVGWGYNCCGQTTTPTNLTGVVAIAAGAYHSLALKSDGTVVGWGTDSYGESTPPTDLAGVVAIAAGAYDGLALKSDGTVVGWGYDYYGEATPPADLTNVVAIAAGYYHSLALKGDGVIVGWGDNGYGEATPPAGLTGGAAAIAAGSYYYSLALTTAPSPPSALTAIIIDTNQVSVVTNLVWSDEFNGTTVDTSKWTYDTGAGGWGNNELEFYTSRTNNAYVTNGLLHIRAQIESTNGSSYTSARLKTQGLFSKTYGGIEFRAKLPQGTGFWPALWTLGTNITSQGWPRCGEIDIMENKGTEPVTIGGAIHYNSAGSPGSDIYQATSYNLPTPGDSVTNFHTYAVQWSTNSIIWLVDGVSVQTWTSWTSSLGSFPAPFDRPQFLLMNVAVGGNYVGNPSMAAINPTMPGEMQVDYVRIYDNVPLSATVRLSWVDNSANEDGFNIERAPDNSGSPGMWAQIAAVGANVTNYSDMGVVANATYWYRVRASGSVCGDSSFSRTVVSLVPPAAPYSLSATGVATNQVEVDLQWYAGSGNEAGYKIERAPDAGGSPGAWTEIATVVGTTNTFYSDTVASATATYWYRVRAYNLIGDSDYSYPISVSVAPPPYQPYLYAYLVATNQPEVVLYWYDYYNYSGSVAGYKIERAPDAGGSPGLWTEIATVSGYNYYSSYTDSAVMPNTTYWYRVRAYNVVGDSPDSYPISIVVGPPLYAPYSLNAYLIATNQAQVDLYWYDYSNDAGSVAGYWIERAPDVGGNPGTWARIAAVQGRYNNFYSDTAVLPNTTYWYRVRAYNVIGNSPSSSPISIGVVPPAAPYYLNASLPTTSREVDLYWYYSSGTEAGYKIERAPDVGGSPGTWTQIATTVGQYSTSYNDTTVETNTTYWYRVRAYNAVGDSPPSYAVSIGPPPAPSNLTSTIAATNQVNLSWSESYANVAGFKIERAPDDNGNPGTWAEIATTLGPYSTSYSDTTVETNTTYWYRVRAYNVLGDSPYSNEASVSLVPPAAPSSLTATPASSSQINLSWTDNSNNETSFKIERSTDGTNFTQIAQVLPNATSYRNTGLLPDTAYYYRVRASNPVADSAFSNVASADTPAQCPLSVVGWGDDSSGQTTPPPGLNGAVAIAAGDFHSLALKDDGTVVGWGYNGYGQTTPPAGLTGVVAIAAGTYHSLAFQSDGTVVGWGYDGYGQATPPAGLTGVVAIEAGYYQSLALKSDGTVVGWGYYYYATPPVGLNGVVAITAGSFHNLALKSDGTVVGWGDNSYGAATPPAGLSNVVAIAAGYYNSLALKSDGTVVGWGNNGDGQATPPAGLTNTVAIAAGSYHSLALKSDGSVVGWGYNGNGQATPPAGLSGVVAIAAGGYHSLALSTTPVAPSGLATVVLSVDEVGLSWSNNVSNEDGFKIERAPDNSGSPGTWTQLVAVAASITNYTDTGLTPKATYWYRMQAYNACTNSPYSTAVSIIVRIGQPVRVMQWNTEHNLGRIANNNTSAAQAIARIVNYNQPDILLFNEINAQNLSADDNQAALIDWVTNNVPYLGTQTFYVAVSSQTDGFNRNAAISRYPILTAGTYDDGLRGLHSFRVQLNGANALQVFHAHLKCCSDDCPRKHYEAQFDADTISAWAATNTIPYIFAGDWNDDEQSPLCSPPNTIRTIREGSGLVEFKPTTLDGEYRTWSTSSASIRFDYILAATNRLAPLSGYVFSSTVWANHGLYSGNSGDSFIASDHYCVFADYFFPGPDFTVTPASALASTGSLGGPFSPANKVYTLTNTNSIPLHWGVTTSANWLTISATNGVLAAGASTNITASIGGAANSLSVGNYSAIIGFQNTVTESPVLRSASLTVLWPPPVVNFTGSPTNGVEPLTVTFSDTSTGNITGRVWNFGDTSTTNTVTNSVTHTFSAGSFSVRLIVSGPGGITTNVRPNYITVLTPFQIWQIQYFGSTNNPSADADGDGQNNMAEFLSGTNPTNAGSFFGITSIKKQGHDYEVTITWKAAGGTTNVVQGGGGDFPNSPVYTDAFYDISGLIIIPGSGDVVTNYVDHGEWLGEDINWPAIYYRVRLVP